MQTIVAAQAVASTEPVTMSSLELVEFINQQRGQDEAELRHDHFMAKVPKVLGEEVAPKFRDYYRASNGKQNPMYRLPKREACLMAMSYSYELQALVYDKMSALERQAQAAANMPIPKTLPEALRLAADLAEKNAQLAHAAQENSLKAQALDRISADCGSFTLTQASKMLGIKLDVLTTRLHQHGWIYRQNASWVAYNTQIKNGRMQYKEAHYTDANTGQVVCKPYCHITPKGLTKLAQMFTLVLRHTNEMAL